MLCIPAHAAALAAPFGRLGGNKRFDVRRLTDTAAGGDQRPHLFGPDDRLGEVGDLGIELGVGEGPGEAADGVLDEEVERAPVGGREGDVDLVLVDARRRLGADLRAQRDDGRVLHRLVGIFVLAAAAVHDRRRAGVIDRELALQPGARRGLAGELEHQRMHLQRDRGDVARLQPCASRSCTQPSIAGWMTMPQAKGL